MLNIRIDMPSGCSSRGYDRPNSECAAETFNEVVRILREWPDFTASVVLSDDGLELQRAGVANA